MNQQQHRTTAPERTAAQATGGGGGQMHVMLAMPRRVPQLRRPKWFYAVKEVV